MTGINTRESALILGLLAPAVAGASGTPQEIVVETLAAAPTVDGSLAEWGDAGWQEVAVTPAIPPEDRAKYGLDPDDNNQVGEITVRMRVGIADGQIFVALRWPDATADEEYQGWEWKGSRYAPDRRRIDDMFAMRFELEGEFDRSMLSAKDYSVDVWVWTAGRSNPSGRALDASHRFSTGLIEDAAEYAVDGVGTVYIKKLSDEGDAIYSNVRPPKKKTEDRLPSVQFNPDASGSSADVAARGVWADGHWTLEMARALDTGQPDDRAFAAGQTVLAQIAVFNRAGSEHKSVSEPLALRLP